MTAVKKYQRLETGGLWRGAPDEQKREVLLSFGDTSLVIRDRSNSPITHWSLSAIERINPGKRPALFEPGQGSGESLEVEDDLMINAIEKVRYAIAKQRPKRGRLRTTIFALIIAAIAAAATFWLPDALVRHAIKVIPDTKREDIGRDLLTEITKLSGDSCNSRLGTTSLTKLHNEVDRDQNLEQVLVLPSDTRLSILLPGRLLLISQVLLEDYDTPEVTAGFIISGSVQSQLSDPLSSLLKEAGTMATLNLLTSGKMETDKLRDHARSLMSKSNTYPTANDLIPSFQAIGVSTRPYSFARDFSGETTLDLIEADPLRGKTPAPLMSDGDWISLQSICEA